MNRWSWKPREDGEQPHTNDTAASATARTLGSRSQGGYGRGSPLAPQNEIPHSATLGSAEVKVLVPKERRCSQGRAIKPKRIFSRSLRAPYNTRCICQNLRAQRWLTVQSRLSIEHPLDSFLFCSHQSQLFSAAFDQEPWRYHLLTYSVPCPALLVQPQATKNDNEILWSYNILCLKPTSKACFQNGTPPLTLHLPHLFCAEPPSPVTSFFTKRCHFVTCFPSKPFSLACIFQINSPNQLII